MVDSKHAERSEALEKEHRHRKNQVRDLEMLETAGKGSGLDTLSEEQAQARPRGKRKLTSDEVKHH